jgi:hypothetical protein
LVPRFDLGHDRSGLAGADAMLVQPSLEQLAVAAVIVAALDSSVSRPAESIHRSALG